MLCYVTSCCARKNNTLHLCDNVTIAFSVPSQCALAWSSESGVGVDCRQPDTLLTAGVVGDGLTEVRGCSSVLVCVVHGAFDTRVARSL
jgi:hypothetical protein